MRDRLLDARLLARGRMLIEKPETAPWLTVRDAIGDLPDPQLAPELAAKCLNHRFQGGARSYVGHTGSPMDEPAKTLKAGVHGVPWREHASPGGWQRAVFQREGECPPANLPRYLPLSRVMD
ncbi:hypothetical protein SPKIRA_37880 (plasmid) [Sphingomonas paucimobilis]|nr:hypothetical protein SPKIRA_37880 [Sphingomonas paucimobilis]